MSTKRDIAATYKKLVGRTIVAVEPNVFDGAREGTTGKMWTSDPTFVFDDGTRLRFLVDETEIGEYGVHPIHLAAKG